MFVALLNLTKPRISLLFAVSGLAALMIEGSLRSRPLLFWLIVLAIFLVGGSANALNQYFERDLDKLMLRTARKRPLPLEKVSPNLALAFAITIGIMGCGMLWLLGGFLAFALGLGTILFYSFYYTLWLKPRTPYNIVIGGAAGATGPLIAWAAATGTIRWESFILFLIIFFWTPPHFWALAICCKDDYAKVGMPMLPLVKGDETTRKQILWYSLTLLPLSASLLFFQGIGWIYGGTAIVLSVGFLALAIRLYRIKSTRLSWQLFGFSIAYLALLFLALIADQLV
ncbi:MAG: protoheme IX farnesyltransferase [Deltaproteobacteria bacterium]|nr:protoheme IX farnesyltransferase [Deltaproteobacteria bacterium]